jgi:transcriptional regulator with XRE-family HTH domain
VLGVFRFEDSDLESFGSKIKRVRLAKDIKQATLANKIGVSQPHLARLEQDQNEPSIGLALALSKELGVSLSYLLGVEEVDRPQHIEDFAEWLTSNNITEQQTASIQRMAEIYLDKYEDSRDFGRLARNIITSFNPEAANWRGIIYSKIKEFWLPPDANLANQGKPKKEFDKRIRREPVRYFLHIENVPARANLSMDYSIGRSQHVVIMNIPSSKYNISDVYTFLVEQVINEFVAIKLNNTVWYQAFSDLGVADARIAEMGYVPQTSPKEIIIFNLRYPRIKYYPDERAEQLDQPEPQRKTLAELRTMVNEARVNIPHNQQQLDDAMDVLTQLLENQGEIPTKQEQYQAEGSNKEMS